MIARHVRQNQRQRHGHRERKPTQVAARIAPGHAATSVANVAAFIISSLWVNARNSSAILARSSAGASDLRSSRVRNASCSCCTGGGQVVSPYLAT